MEDNNNYNITTKINVEYKRKNKLYKKNIFILMDENMKKNINLENNKLLFSDAAFCCVLLRIEV